MNIMTTQKDSPKGKLNVEDIKKLGWNALVFSAPALAALFSLLAQGVSFKLAWPVALVIFWGLLADFLKKLNTGK